MNTPIWKYFNEICQVPRPSKKEEKIIAYLENFAKSHNLEYRKDKAGNIVIIKGASGNPINKDTVILQSHMDMVCEKNNDKVHNFDTDPIEQVIDGEWLKANGTTLGADNGIGMAAQLALLASTDITHAAIECLFTVDEETGLSGAFALEEGMLTGNTLINLDSEEDGEFCIGCAGGIDTVANFKYTLVDPAANSLFFKVTVKGLKGGHSGADIHLGLGNANKILNRFLWQTMRKTSMQLAHIDGGNLRNAIAREATATIAIPASYKEHLRVDLNHFINDIEAELLSVEPDVKIELESECACKQVFDNDTTSRLTNAIYAAPHGPIRMSVEMEGLVETSTNLASIKMRQGNIIEINTSQRSSVESSKYDIAYTVESCFKLAGAEVSHGDGYPGWKPNPDSPVAKLVSSTYERLFNEKAIVTAIHAGLECGLFLKKYPYLDMVSMGPTMRGVHSPDEKLHIPATEKFWQLLLEVLK